MGTWLEQQEREQEEWEREHKKNVLALARRAKGVIHRLKWLQGAEWANDVKFEKEATDGEYRKVDGWTKWVPTAWAKVLRPDRTYVVNKVNLGKVGAVCSIGAVSYAACELGLSPYGEEYNEVVELLNEADDGDIVDFNDTPGRTKNEVKEVFGKAVELAEKRFK